GAAIGQDGLLRPYHVRSIRRVADHLQGIVGLDRAGHVELAAIVERPAAMAWALDRADILRELRPAFGLPLPQKAIEKDVLGRDRGVGLELEYEMPVRLLKGGKRLSAPGGNVAGMCGQGRRGGNLGHVNRGGTRRHRWGTSMVMTSMHGWS